MVVLPQGVEPRAVLWWSAHWIRVVLITIAITVAWLLVLVVFTNLHG